MRAPYAACGLSNIGFEPSDGVCVVRERRSVTLSSEVG